MSEIQKIQDEYRSLRERIEHLEKERERDRQVLEQLRSERNEIRQLLYRPLWEAISEDERRRWSEDTNEEGCQTLDEFLPELRKIVQEGKHV